MQAPEDLIRIAIVEDQPEFMQALIGMVEDEPDMELAGFATTLRDSLALIAQGAAADVLVVDLGLPDGSGIDIIRAASRHWPSCSVLVSSAFIDSANVLGSIEAGAAGYLVKHASPTTLAEELRSVYRGGSPISPQIARQILTRFRALPPAVPVSESVVAPTPAEVLGGRLSPREREVLELITKGFTADEISGFLQVSKHTVLTFIRRIYGKLNVNSRTEAIFEARAQGFLR